MSYEIEVKVPIGDVADFSQRLGLIQAVPVSPRHFEDNFVLDFPDGRLRSRASLLRVRTTEKSDFLTYKGPPLSTGIFKTREELETPVKSGAVLLRVLEKLGMQIWFRYQKYRQEYALTSARSPAEEILVAVDETPIGNYVELEGSQEGIREISSALGFSESQFLRDSYYSLYVRFCRERGETAAHMTFLAEDSGQTPRC